MTPRATLRASLLLLAAPSAQAKLMTVSAADKSIEVSIDSDSGAVTSLTARGTQHAELVKSGWTVVVRDTGRHGYKPRSGAPHCWPLDNSGGHYHAAAGAPNPWRDAGEAEHQIDRCRSNHCGQCRSILQRVDSELRLPKGHSLQQSGSHRDRDRSRSRRGA